MNWIAVAVLLIHLNKFCDPVKKMHPVSNNARYRRSYDSEYTAPLVNHHIWPCLMQGIRVLVKGEAHTRRGASLVSIIYTNAAVVSMLINCAGWKGIKNRVKK